MLLKLNIPFRGKNAGDLVDRDLSIARRMIDQGIADPWNEKKAIETSENKMERSPRRAKRSSREGINRNKKAGQS